MPNRAINPVSSVVLFGSVWGSGAAASCLAREGDLAVGLRSGRAGSAEEDRLSLS